ncbi:WD repeat-containing protein 3 [Coccinella septempunctata]|uniref:WD repeat-containing protein 3 n=1 Tax=Coccinella septempunctata TaxID=41139 RepID=UPI001D05C8AC|nr:WD repeat-containing protein 3 [Coccinella septempunctata]
MGKTKDYLGFVPAGNFNIIASGTSNVSFVTLDGQEGRFVAVAACEHVVIWDMRRGEKAQVLNGEKTAVTAICASPNKRQLAVGYANGLVQLFDLKSGDMLNPYQGHTSAITTLAFDEGGFLLASGSLDTEVVIWDLYEEKGLCRLSGHTGPITKVVFMSKMNVVITASKDTHVKFWDLDTKYCFKTVVGLGTEVWSLVLMREEKYMVTAASDQTLGIWKLVQKGENDENDMKQEDNPETHEDDDLKYPLRCYKIGTVARAGIGRSVFMCADASGQILACHGKNQLIEIFQFLSDEEADAKLKKRVKRLRKRSRTEDEEAKVELTDKDLSKSVLDIVKRLQPIKLTGKPKSTDIVLGRGNEVRLAVCMRDNELELHAMNCGKEENEAKCLKKISYLQGHQSEVRAVAFSSDNQLIVSGSGESIKSWNRSTQARVMTLETSSIVTVAFVPGDRYVLAGTKKGEILIVDIAAGEIVEDIAAHDKEVRSLCLTSDLRGVVSGGIDKAVKFWQFELIQDKNNTDSKGKVLSLIHSRTLKLEDGVWCVRVSKNGKFLAVALSDSTVKIFFVDSFKLFLSLYGHKQPVLSMDISSDSAIIATGSSDRNVKIWGMDYGNCHKSIFAHDDSITGLQFVPGTHLFFTCGKDGKIKQWDGDSFQKVITLQGHIGEAYGLAVSPNGKFVISCGSDRVLRLYEKSDEIIEIGDQEEMEREQQEPLATGNVTVVPGHGELSLPSKKTVGCEAGADNILEALQVCEQYELALEECRGNAKPPLPPLMMAYQVETIDDYLMKVIKSIRPSDLEQALLLLPFEAVCRIMKYCPMLLEKEHDFDAIMTIFSFLLRVHHSTILQTEDLFETMEKFSEISFVKSKELKDLIGNNLCTLKYIQRKYEGTEMLTIFKDDTIKKQKKITDNRKREKRKLNK